MASIDGINKPLIAEIATTIIMIGETIPAETAASPNTKPPNIETAVPKEEGIRISLSLKISKAIIMRIASKKAGKGTLCLCLVKLNKRLIGIASGLCVVIQT